MTISRVKGYFSATSIWGAITMCASWEGLTLEEASQAADLMDQRIHPTEIFPDRLVTHGEIVPASHQSGKQ